MCCLSLKISGNVPGLGVVGLLVGLVRWQTNQA